MPLLFKKKKKNTEIPLDRRLLSYIQPKGGITYRDEKFISTGDTYICCIHIYEFPKTIGDFWLEKLMNIPNTIAIMDILTEDTIQVKKNINNSMKEQNVRYRESKEYSDKLDAEQRFYEMKALYKELETMGQVLKSVVIRIFIADRNRYDLEERSKEIMDSLEADGYKTTVFLNEGKMEWVALIKSMEEQTLNPFHVPGQALTSKQIAAGYPFRFSSLEDPYGKYLGYTACGGNVIFSPFTKTATRSYYNSIVFGNMGFGKSTLLKKLFEQASMIGDFVRTFDITGEFAPLTLEMGGRIIKSGEKIINPLEILKAAETEQLSYLTNIKRLTVLYKCMNPDYTMQEITMYQNTLKELYLSFGIDTAGTVTGLPAKSYPIFSDYLQFLNKKAVELSKINGNALQKQVIAADMLTLNQIKKVIERIVDTYGYLFNGHTTFDNIVDEQIVTFDISGLKDLEDNVFDAVMFNMLTMCYGNCVTNGSVMKNKYEQGELKLDEVAHTLIIADESHRWLNSEKPDLVHEVNVYQREARKYFGGTLFASQSIRDYVPDDTNKNGLTEIKTLFELSQYKFIFKQDSNVLPKLEQVFNSELTPDQLKRIPYLEMGQCLLCISGEQNIEFKVHLSAQEKKLFSGGA